MERLGYYNGKYGPLEEMTVPMTDRACFFGDGIYEAGACRNYKHFAMEDHLDRFFRNVGEMELNCPVSRDELRSTLEKLVHEMDSGDLLVYYQLTRGAGNRQHYFTEGPGNLWITLTPAKYADGRTPIQLITQEDIRFHRCDIKTLNLIPAVMASQRAREAGCAEAVLFRPGGRVTECAHSNVHIIKDGVLKTAPLDNLILPGVARKHLLMAARALNIPVLEEPYYLDELWNADEILVTSTTKIITHADKLDGVAVGMKDPETYEKLRAWVQEEFLKATE